MIEFLLLLLVLAVIGIPLLAAFMAMGLIGAEGRGRRKATARKDEILDEVFAGSPPVARYNARPIDTLPASIVTDEAVRRGYVLTNNDNGDLWFERRS